VGGVIIALLTAAPIALTVALLVKNEGATDRMLAVRVPQRV
jgi:hypothetical protein